MFCVYRNTFTAHTPTTPTHKQTRRKIQWNAENVKLVNIENGKEIREEEVEM